MITRATRSPIDETLPHRRTRRFPLPGRDDPLLFVCASRGPHGESSRPPRRAAPHLLVAVALSLAACASSDSARYVQFREIQANLNDRAAEALKAGLIDAAVAKRVLATSEAVAEQAEKYRAALASGAPRSVTRAVLDVMQRLLDEAETLLPEPELAR